MRLLVQEKHDGYGIFPLFPTGTAVTGIEVNDEYPHWCSCRIDGQETFIPDVYVADGLLTKDYNPTELIVAQGQIVTLLELVFEWLYVLDEHGNKGWLPASKVISL